ncbi:MAG: sigma-70 family RNA polymerase sigma factor [Acidimicrobiales bacterium]
MNSFVLAPAAGATEMTLSWEVLMRSDAEFDRFFCSHYPGVVRSLTVITGNREAAADCTQEAFIRAYARWGRVRRYASPTAWVRRVAINLANDQFRSDDRRRRREDRFHVGRQQFEGPASTTVDHDLVLGSLLGSLTPQQRSVAALFYVEDLPVLEIATTLGLSEGAVKFHLHSARKALRTSLEAAEEVDHV